MITLNVLLITECVIVIKIYVCVFIRHLLKYSHVTLNCFCPGSPPVFLEAYH